MNTRALSGLAKLAAAFTIGWLYFHGYGQGPTGILTQAKGKLTGATTAITPLFKPSTSIPRVGVPR